MQKNTEELNSFALFSVDAARGFETCNSSWTVTLCEVTPSGFDCILLLRFSVMGGKVGAFRANVEQFQCSCAA